MMVEFHDVDDEVNDSNDDDELDDDRN